MRVGTARRSCLAVWVAATLAPSLAGAQIRTLQGRVRCDAGGDARQKRGIAYADVYTDRWRDRRPTDGLGFFSLSIEPSVSPGDIVRSNTTIFIAGKAVDQKSTYFSESMLRRFRGSSVVHVGVIDLNKDCDALQEALAVLNSRTRAAVAASRDLPEDRSSGGSLPHRSIRAVGTVVGSAAIAAAAGTVEESAPVQVASVQQGANGARIDRSPRTDFTVYSYAHTNSNLGFTFTPTRETAEAAFWNVAAVETYDRAIVASQIGLPGLGRASLVYPVTQSVAFVAGYERVSQTTPLSLLLAGDSARRALGSRQDLYVGALSVRPWWYLAFGASLKYRVEHNESATQLFVPASKFRLTAPLSFGSPTLGVQGLSGGRANADLSLNVFPLPFLNVGVSLLDVAGGDANVSESDGGPSLRHTGVGISVELNRLQLGAETLFGSNGDVRPAFGANFSARPDLDLRVAIGGPASTLVAGGTFGWVGYTFHSDRRWGISHELTVRRRL